MGLKRTDEFRQNAVHRQIKKSYVSAVIKTFVINHNLISPP